MRCPNCGFENPEGMNFCGKCAAPLMGQTQTPKPTQTDKQKDKAVPEAERRQLTVMFCDLAGSTALSEQLDPEELREVMRDYQEVCGEVIDRFKGYIGQYLGDGVLVYFGYPLAHEDDAQRAVRAGLEIVGAVRELPLLKTRLQQPLQVRVGIHTGSVVVGEMGRGEKREQLALGDTLNIASRLQNLAEPNTVVISSATYRLTEGLFECRDLGLHTLKGVSTPMQLYRVLRERDKVSRFDVTITRGLTPLVGREEELELLLGYWEKVKGGMGQVVLLCGEPGIGKSRLVQVLKDRLAGESYVKIESHCSPYYQNSALYPAIDHLHRLLQFRREDSPEEKLSKLERALEQYGFSLEEAVPLFASLLSLPISKNYSSITMTPQRQKEKTLEALLAWLLKDAEKKPMLFIVEDLHWVDPSTLEFLSLVIGKVPESRIFALFILRPDFSPPWAVRPYLTNLTLSRLDQKEVKLIVKRVVGEKALPAEVVQQIVAKTDGIPLFVEELTKMVIESGLLREDNGSYVLTGPLPPLAIPITLQDSLMARLDRVATVKEVAQLGATLGREFTYELLQAVSPLDEATLQRELTKLVEAELLYQRDFSTQAKYIFKHALIQDAAYQSLLKSKRQQYHQRIAQVLEGRFPETVKTQPELLAYHYTEAGFREQAIIYWHKSGEKAIGRSANVEAISHLTKGLELIKTLSDTAERIQQELSLQITLGAPLMATKGIAAPEVEQAYTRARELCLQVGETPQLFPVLHGLYRFYHVRGEFQTAREVAEQCLRLAQSVQDPALLVEAHRALGVTLFFLGELVSARAHLEQGVTCYDPQKHRSHAFLYVHDPGVLCLSYAAVSLWFLGYPDQALKKIHEALNLAQELSHPHSLALALNWAAVLHQLRREGQKAQERAETAITLSTEQGFALHLAIGTIPRGWALAEQGQGEEGIAQMRQGLAALRATGAEFWRPYYLARVAEAYGKVGQTEEGLTVLAEALDTAHKNGERLSNAELHWLKGELMLALSQENQAESEACFRQAIDIARQQSAKSLELRAVMSLSRLWQKHGKKKEAREMLAEIYGWFTEGFDTRDLKEARALLEEVS